MKVYELIEILLKAPAGATVESKHCFDSGYGKRTLSIFNVSTDVDKSIVTLLSVEEGS